ncbi:MAG: response regulator transcription factor [Alphaproteobacteria bacterium]|nr:response regulator transcription factor [Alphaproteobacteria bacterium]
MLICDPIAANRSATRSSFAALGFGRAVAVADLDSFARSWAATPFDLLVADVTENPTQVYDLVRSIRDGKIGKNPFVHMVLTAWKLEGDLVQAALSCGADDLIMRPFSVDLLSRRVRTNMASRKQFVVTADYMGPDRRRAPPRNSPSLMQVPNILLAKARNGQKGGVSAMEEVKLACRKVDAERMRRCAFKIACLFHTLRDAADAKQSLENELDKMETTANDLAARLRSTPLKDAQQSVASLLSGVGSVRSGGAVAPIDGLSRALLDALYPKQDRAQLWQEVEATVATIKSRERGKG